MTINLILTHAINGRSELRLLNVSPLFCEEKNKDARKASEPQEIVKRLNIQNPKQFILKKLLPRSS
jgi:hypothetical protein